MPRVSKEDRAIARNARQSLRAEKRKKLKEWIYDNFTEIVVAIFLLSFFILCIAIAFGVIMVSFAKVAAING